MSAVRTKWRCERQGDGLSCYRIVEHIPWWSTTEIHNGTEMVPAQPCFHCHRGRVRTGWFRREKCRQCDGSGLVPMPHVECPYCRTRYYDADRIIDTTKTWMEQTHKPACIRERYNLRPVACLPLEKQS